MLGMSLLKQGIPPENFYSGISSQQNEIEAIVGKEESYGNLHQPKFLTRLLGPSRTWKIFKKQQDAIDCCLCRRNGLMPFAFEDINARRMFLVAHPKVFWESNFHRFFKNCSTYEIIREHSACKLYLDLEYEYKYNEKINGDTLLKNVLDIINFNFKKIFNITCSSDDILDLDSSNDIKFSHHVIYEIKNTAFQDNYAVGNFLKEIFGEFKAAFETNSLGDNTKLQEISIKYNLPVAEIIDLFIYDRKGQRKLFIDEGVYTKNRHFRLLGSSKLTKGVPLRISKNSRYKPSKAPESVEYFLDSLITYFSWKVEKVLEFDGSERVKPLKMSKCPKRNAIVGSQSCSVHLQIDSFVNKLVSPKGWIRRKVYFSDSLTIVYDIQGYRYCYNVKREHKSNNIKLVVDLENLGFYQKCYDPDCADFRSDMMPLPHEIRFLFEDDSLFVGETADLEDFAEEEFVKTLEKKEGGQSFEQSIPDEDLEKVLDCAEAISDISW